MAKAKQSYICNNCNYIAPKWLGKCPECSEWNTLIISIEQSSAVSGFKSQDQHSASAVITHSFDDIVTTNHERLLTGIDEWDRVMGGGIMPSSLMVLTGDPGIGKSTLLLAISQKLQIKYSVLYVSTEESLAQVKQRAERLRAQFSNNIQLSKVYIVSIPECVRKTIKFSPF